jgi:serine protease Do
MLPRLTDVLLLAVGVLTCWPADVLAQPVPDRGKKKLPPLFVEVSASAAESTIRVQCDDKDAALGTIVAADGFILTKGSELRGTITCRLRDGRVLKAKVIGYHKPTDLALLKVDATGLKPIAFAANTEAVVGNWVAVPSPGPEPIAVGVISAPVRKLYREESFVENYNKGYLGVMGIRDAEDTDGAMIGEVDPHGTGFRSGLRSNDLIFEVAGKPIRDRDALLAALGNYRPGDQVALRVRRGEEERALVVKFGTRSTTDRGTFQNGMGGALSGRRTGFPAIVQHDTVLRPSDCGGPLVDLDGKVLGINIARAGRVETWTLPGEVIRPLLKDLMAGKYGDDPAR